MILDKIHIKENKVRINCNKYVIYVKTFIFDKQPMGVLPHGQHTLELFARLRIVTSGNFPPHVSAESPLEIYPNLSEVISVLEP
jgi:hypothetical protein